MSVSFRTVVITKQCKCSYKNGFLIVREEDTKMIHLSEMYCLILDTTAVSITAYLITELISRKIPIIFCDEMHNPCGETLPLYGSHNTSKKIHEQVSWKETSMQAAWTKIVSEKIRQQALHLKEIENSNSEKLFQYVEEMEFNDVTNREGHAAKVYFNSLFGKSFNRDENNDINAALNYGYAILLSVFNREIIANGYLTQIGIRHKNEFNPFNLSCDLMEPFRPIVDRYIFSKQPFIFDKTIRFGLINLMNNNLIYDGCKYFLSTVIGLYTKDVLKAVTDQTYDEIKFYKYER